VLPVWGGVTEVYFLAAEIYLWKKTGINIWKIWWQTNADNLKTERRFAEEIRKFPEWNFGYQTIKWGTLPVVIGYFIAIFAYVSQK
jgi:hypothetical protein